MPSKTELLEEKVKRLEAEMSMAKVTMAAMASTLTMLNDHIELLKENAQFLASEGVIHTCVIRLLLKKGLLDVKEVASEFNLEGFMQQSEYKTEKEVENVLRQKYNLAESK